VSDINNSHTDMILKESALSTLYTDVEKNSLHIESFLFIDWTTELESEVVHKAFFK
jgi:hypothetical protein